MKKIFFFLLFITVTLYSQTENKSVYNTISGIVSYQNKPIPNVSVFVEETMRFTTTDAKGFYSIEAKTGETISYSYVGLKKVFVLIEDITSVLNINMEIENSIKDLNLNTVPKLGEGTIGDNQQTYFIKEIKGDSLNKNATSLTKAIIEKVPNLFVKINKFGEEVLYLRGRELEGPAIWFFDDFTFDIPLPVYINEVKDVLVINTEEIGFIIRVKTTIDYTKIKDINYENYYFTDADYYRNDAIKFKKIKNKTPIYLEEYQKRANSNKALEIYLKQYSKYKNEVNYHLNLYNFFKREKYNKNILLKVLSDFESFSADNPENLKAIAYKYQEINEHEKALSDYKKIVKIRPNYSQSFRDLANTFLVLKNYSGFWLAYKYYLNRGFKFDDNDIGDIMTSEIMAAYNLDIEDKSIRQKIKINNPQKNIESDIRLVFEWNTSEAEFILEFVNPDLVPFIVENSSNKNNDLIIDQKKKGYTSKEVFIENVGYGNWLINLTYLGNKQNKPTFFKITTYSNWGRSNQSEKINVYDFTLQNVKMQLLKLNSNSL